MCYFMSLVYSGYAAVGLDHKDCIKFRHSNKLAKIRFRLWKRNPVCVYCQKKLYLFEEATIDHKLPKSKGGTNRQGNLCLCCKKCNGDKADKILPTKKKAKQPNLKQAG